MILFYESLNCVYIFFSHLYFSKMCWVARRRGNVIVPPVSLGREEVMASNLSRQARFQIALERAKSPKDRKEMLGKVSLKVFKMEKVEPYSTRSKIQRVQEALKGTDISAGIYGSFK